MSSFPASTSVNRLCLISIDGWGIRAVKDGNAIANAETPTMNRLASEGLFALIDASGLAVGLPEGVMGNSEVGHLTMGAGRVNYQDLVRINKSLADGSLATNTALIAAFKHAKSGSGRTHFVGLVSDGGVHSHIAHLKGLVDAAKVFGVNHSFVHFIADGRDTKPTSGTTFIKDLQEHMTRTGYGRIGTVIGRYYAMDRDKRWERVSVAYAAIVGGSGESTSREELISTVESRYAANENDEFLKPLIVESDGAIKDGDAVVFFDFRSDRMREIVSVFAHFHCTADVTAAVLPFDVTVRPRNLFIVQMTQYDEKLTLPIMFPAQTNTNGLSEWISKAQLKQFHTAETEKYAHVTFFFAGGREEAFPLESRMLIPSPKVSTYDLSPEMSQSAVADSVVNAINSNEYHFVLCNFAAPDMVGHTGMYEPALKACGSCDTAIGRIATACKDKGYILVVTADHGNAEEMKDECGNPKTSHTSNPIPFIVVNVEQSGKTFRLTDAVSALVSSNSADSSELKLAGGLSDVAPSVLTLMGLPIPSDMTGHSLVQ